MRRSTKNAEKNWRNPKQHKRTRWIINQKVMFNEGEHDKPWIKVVVFEEGDRPQTRVVVFDEGECDKQQTISRVFNEGEHNRKSRKYQKPFGLRGEWWCSTKASNWAMALCLAISLPWRIFWFSEHGRESNEIRVSFLVQR